MIDPAARVAASATVGPLCVIEAGAVIGERTHLQAQVFVGRNASVGADCWFMPGVAVTGECVVKDRVRLQPGVIVGADGFGYEFIGGRHEKVPQVGNVVIENDVEIGANSTFDRARFSQTVVGEGTKIDNLVQIAHNVVIGKHCLVISQTGIAGSSRLGNYVTVAAQSGVAGHVSVGDKAILGARTGVTSNLEGGITYLGNPAVPFAQEQKIRALVRRLPKLVEDVRGLKKGGV